MLALPALASLQTSNVSRGTNAGQGAPPSREQQVDSMDIEVTTARLRICGEQERAEPRLIRSDYEPAC